MERLCACMLAACAGVMCCAAEAVPALLRTEGGETVATLDAKRVGVVAPRLLYVSSATEDDWAGPRGEFAAGVLASEAWGLYGLPGLAGAFPPPDTPIQSGRVGYHLRSGEHAIKLYDWQRYIDFADRHW